MGVAKAVNAGLEIAAKLLKGGSGDAEAAEGATAKLLEAARPAGAPGTSLEAGAARTIGDAGKPIGDAIRLTAAEVSKKIDAYGLKTLGDDLEASLKSNSPINVESKRADFPNTTIENASKLATDLDRNLTLHVPISEGQVVKLPVAPGADPENLYADLLKAPEMAVAAGLRDARYAAERQAEEDAIAVLAKTEPRTGAALTEALNQGARESGSDPFAFGVSTLRHPAEMKEFAKRFHEEFPETAMGTLNRAIDRLAQPGTTKFWQEAIAYARKMVSSEAPKV